MLAAHKACFSSFFKNYINISHVTVYIHIIICTIVDFVISAKSGNRNISCFYRTNTTA